VRPAFLVCFVELTLTSSSASNCRLDTAKVYKNENVIGRAIKDSRIDRKELFITSKLSPADHGVNAREAFLESLDELGLGVHFSLPSQFLEALFV